MNKRNFIIQIEENTYDNGNILVTANISDEKGTILNSSAVSKNSNEYSFKNSTIDVIDLLFSNINLENIKEGDYVRVVDSGKTYTTNTEWVGKNTSSELAAHYVYGYSPNANEKFKVIKRVDNMLYIGRTYELGSIEKISGCYLIHIDGVEKICSDRNKKN